jgi:hypothetical protein
MAISVYSELKTAVADHLHRSDLTSVIPDFVLMGESRMNRELRIIDMITTQTGTLSTSVATLAIPTRYADKLQFRLNDPVVELTWVSPLRIKQYALDLTQTGQPEYYTVTDTFEFDRIPDEAYSYTLKYYKGYQLSGASDTNYLLTNYPQAYLYAAMQAGYLYMGAFDKAAQMNAVVAAEIATIKRAEARRKGSDDSVLTIEDAFGGRRYNINEG